MDIIPSIESILTALIVLIIVVGTFSTSTAAFNKLAVLGVQADRVTNSALLVQSEKMTIRSELSGYNISYRQSSSSIILSYGGERARNDVTRLESAYSGIKAPKTSTRIDSYLCISNKDDILYLTVDRCPA